MSSTGAETSAQDVRRDEVLTSDASQLPVHASVPDFICNSNGDHSLPPPVRKLPVRRRSRLHYLANYFLSFVFFCLFVLFVVMNPTDSYRFVGEVFSVRSVSVQTQHGTPSEKKGMCGCCCGTD